MPPFSVRPASTALAAVMLLTSTTQACPFCDSSTAQQVRDGIFNSDFTYNMGVAAAPFIVLSAVLILILYWPTPRCSELATRRGALSQRINESAEV